MYRIILALMFLTLPALADPLDPHAVQVVDGDTVRVEGKLYRLIGLDAPETYRAQCASERELGNRATFRLRQLVAGGGVDLQRIACSCRGATIEGTPSCNYGRFCAVMTVRGKDVAATMISEGLARPYECGPRGCPPRNPWCG